MTNDSIRLERPGAAIVPVILSHLPPVRQSIKCNPPHDHYEHCQANKQKPVNTPPLHDTSLKRHILSIRTTYITRNTDRISPIALHRRDIGLCGRTASRNGALT